MFGIRNTASLCYSAHRDLGEMYLHCYMMLLRDAVLPLTQLTHVRSVIAKGTSGMHPRDFLDFHLDGETDTAACFDIIAHSSSRYSVWVLRRRSVRAKGPPRGCGSFYRWIHRSG